MNKFVPVFLIFIFSACASIPIPQIVQGKGSVYGTLTAQSHSKIIEKAKEGKDHDYASGGSIIFNKDMVNYRNLKDLYACLIDPTYKGGKKINVTATAEGLSPRSLALSPGDIVSINNSTDRSLTFFLADMGDAFQDLGQVSPGQTKPFTIKIQGNLELGTDEDERIKTIVLSQSGLRSIRVASGQAYSFEKLEPGSYNMIFWFWRLGKINKQVQINPGQNTIVHETLSVNTVMR
jgi:hypothetical protein